MSETKDDESDSIIVELKDDNQWRIVIGDRIWHRLFAIGDRIWHKLFAALAMAGYNANPEWVGEAHSTMFDTAIADADALLAALEKKDG